MLEVHAKHTSYNALPPSAMSSLLLDKIAVVLDMGARITSAGPAIASRLPEMPGEFDPLWSNRVVRFCSVVPVCWQGTFFL